MFVMSQAQHRRVEDVGLWAWVAQVGLTHPVTKETHLRDVSATHEIHLRDVPP